MFISGNYHHLLRYNYHKNWSNNRVNVLDNTRDKVKSNCGDVEGWKEQVSYLLTAIYDSEWWGMGPFKEKTEAEVLILNLFR